jgi:hypothetical protein
MVGGERWPEAGMLETRDNSPAITTRSTALRKEQVNNPAPYVRSCRTNFHICLLWPSETACGMMVKSTKKRHVLPRTDLCALTTACVGNVFSDTTPQGLPHMKGTATFPNGTKYVGSVRARVAPAPAHLDACFSGRPARKAGRVFRRKRHRRSTVAALFDSLQVWCHRVVRGRVEGQSTQRLRQVSLLAEPRVPERARDGRGCSGTSLQTEMCTKGST